MVDLEGTSTGLYNGSHIVATTPTGTTFTYDSFGTQDDPNPPTGGTITVFAKNIVRWNMQQYKTLQSFIYRSTNSGETYSLIGIAEGMDGSFVDWNVYCRLPITLPRRKLRIFLLPHQLLLP